LAPEQDLSLIPTDQATINDTYIWFVEALVPPKQEILWATETQNEQELLKFARVVLFEGSQSEHGMREYKVILRRSTSL
jgi:hypothetical protein